MKKTAIMIFLLVMGIGSVCSAQTQKEDSVAGHIAQISSGIYSFNGVNQLYSEKIYCGTAPFAGLKLMFNKEHQRQQVEVLYTRVQRDLYHLPIDPGQIIDANSQLTSDLFHLNYTYFQPIPLPRIHFVNLYLTGNLLTFVDWVRSGYFELVSSSIAPGVYLETQVHRQRFWLQGSLPVVSLATRKNYATATAQNFERFNVLQDLRRNLRVLLPGQYHGFEFSAGWDVKLCKSTRLALGYALYYTDDNYPRPVCLSSGIYSVGLGYQF